MIHILTLNKNIILVLNIFSSKIIMAYRYDKPYRTLINIDNQKINELFELINQMDTQQLTQYSLLNNIPLCIQLPTGHNLIHQVLLNDDKLKTEFSKLNVIKYLVQNEVNPDEPTRDNQTPIHISCQKQYEHITKYLINECNVDLNYKDNNGFTALHYLLSGNISLYEKKESTELISFQRKDNINKKDKILEIKKLIYDIIKDDPFLKSLEESIYESLINSSKINDKAIEVDNLINKKISSTDPTNLLKDNKEILIIQINAMKKIIEDLWNKFTDTTKLDIHTPTIDSYKKNDIGIIQDANIKKILKKDINDGVDIIITKINEIFNDSENEIYPNDDDIITYIYQEFYKTGSSTITPVPPLVPAPVPPPTYNHIYNVIYQDNKEDVNNFNNINNTFLLSNISNDNADNIILFNSKEFIGGSRKLLLNIGPIDYNNIPPLRKLFITETNYSLKFKKLFLFVILDDYNTLYNILMPRSILINEINKVTLDDITNINNLYNTPTNSNNDKYIFDYINTYYDKIENVFYISEIYYKYTELLCNINPNIDNNLYGEYNILVMNFMSCLMNNQFTFDHFIANLTFYLMIPYYRNFNINFDETFFLQTSFLKFIDPLEDENNPNYTSNIINKIHNTEYVDIIMNILINIANLQSTPKIIENITEQLYNLFNSGYIKVPEIMLCDFIYMLKNLKNYELFIDIIYQKNYSNLIFDFYDFINLFINQQICSSDKLLIDKNTEILYKILLSDIPPSFQGSIYLYINILNEIDNYNINHNTNYGIGDQYNNIDIKEYHFSKFKEAIHLKLNYLGTLPELKYEGNTDFSKSFNIKISNTITLLIDNEQFDILTYKIDKLPLPFNYVCNYTNNQVNNNIDKTRLNSAFFIHQQNQYRPPIKLSYEKLLISYYNRIYNYLKNIFIHNKMSFNVLFTSIKMGKITNISKYYLCFYQIINILIKHQTNIYNKITNIPNMPNMPNIKKINLFNITDLNTFFNNLNGNIFLYYYLFSKSNDVKIPKFSYYKLGINKFYYLDSSEEVLLPYENIIDNTNIGYTKTIPENNIVSVKYSNNYLNNLLLSNNIIENKQYEQQRNTSIPPSMELMLNKFFEYNKIKLFINLDSTKYNIILTNIKTLLADTKININNNNIEAHQYYYLFKLIEEIIKDQTDLYMTKAINKHLNNKYISEINSIEQFYDINDFNTNIKIDDILYNNYYIFKDNYVKKCDFIIYPNEYNNTNVLKQMYCLRINQTLLNFMISKDSDPYIIDDYGHSIISPIEKTYHYETIKTLHKNNIDLYRYNFSRNPLHILKLESINHINKLINDISGNLYINSIDNFISSQFNELLVILKSNDRFGYNIINYLEISFKTCFYIMHEYLTDTLWVFTNKYNYTFKNMQDIFRITLNDKDNIKKNYLIDNIKNIPNSNDDIILIDHLNNLEIELQKEKETLQRYNDSIQYYTMTNMIADFNIVNDIKESNDKINDLENKKIKINININRTSPIYSINKKPSKIIEKYDEINDKGIYLKCWDELFKNNSLDKSWNLDIIKILKYEKNLLINNLIEENNDYKIINKFYEQVEIPSKIYFEDSNYTDQNNIKKFVYNLLEHLTSSFICYNIEMLLRDILMKYFISLNVNDDFNKINDKINYLLNTRVKVSNNTKFIDILYKEIPKEFVKNSVDLFANESEKQLFESKSIKEILNDLFEMLSFNDILSIPNKSQIMQVLTSNLSEYFDLFVQKLINNWLVVIENIFKFNINQYRINKTILELVKV